MSKLRKRQELVHSAPSAEAESGGVGSSCVLAKRVQNEQAPRFHPDEDPKASKKKEKKSPAIFVRACADLSETAKNSARKYSSQNTKNPHNSGASFLILYPRAAIRLRVQDEQPPDMSGACSLWTLRPARAREYRASKFLTCPEFAHPVPSDLHARNVRRFLPHSAPPSDLDALEDTECARF